MFELDVFMYFCVFLARQMPDVMFEVAEMRVIHGCAKHKRPIRSAFSLAIDL